MAHPDESTLADRVLHAAAARLTGGVSPIGIGLAWFDWATHLATSPGRQFELMRIGLTDALREWDLAFTQRDDPDAYCGHLCEDRRFNSSHWQQLPFSMLARQFLALERWSDEAVHVHGVSERHRALLGFLMRQSLDIFAPSNYILTNPDILGETLDSGGLNLVKGALNAIDDTTQLMLSGTARPPSEKLKIGMEVATTEGVVVARTPIAEIIQYRPKTPKVHAEPIVIVPAWIMKYYILDLSPSNSLVRYLVEQGYTVFMVSWKNPSAGDRDVSFDDYRTQGVMAAIDAAEAITGAKSIHATGYCLGGTLLAIAAAAMARDGDNRLASISLFASQVDFHDAGELRLFINESQLALIEDMMWMRGYLKADEMAGAFHILRSNDLIWSRMISNYAMGEREKPLDIMRWSEDATRMPYRMHSEYLRQLYLENQLAEGAMIVDGAPVVLREIKAPIFTVGTEWDHVAPWRSVYKIHLAAESDVTFVLTNGGHNAGIVSEPGHRDRHYRMATQGAGDPYISPERWFESYQPIDGSWWPAWTAWLDHISASETDPPPLGAPALGYPILGPAPGRFVLG
jgi:polyhydroxyalkanoate synthase subunit PhaC